jgi:Ca2+-transporting ATPase
MNIFVALNLRFPKDTAFQHATFSNYRLIYTYIWVVLGSILITETHLFQSIFGTTSLTAYQWGLCLIPGVILFAVGEIFKATLRYREQNSPVAV